MAHDRRGLLERTSAVTPSRSRASVAIALLATLVVSGCGSSSPITYIDAHDQAAIAHVIFDLNEKASNCAVESVFRQPHQEGAGHDVETLVAVFQKNPDAVDAEQHERMDSVLDHAITQLQTCDPAREVARLRAAIAAAHN